MKPTPARAALLALLAAPVILLGACGGDDETTTSSATTPSTGATGSTGETGATGAASSGNFTAAANQICAQGNEKLDQAFSQLQGNGRPSPDEIAKVIVPNVSDQIEQIRALDPPSDVEGALDEAQDEVDQIKANPSLATKPNAFADVNQQLEAAGLGECAG